MPRGTVECVRPRQPKPGYGEVNARSRRAVCNLPFAIRMTMPEYIEDLQQRYVELKKRIDLVGSYL